MRHRIYQAISDRMLDVQSRMQTSAPRFRPKPTPIELDRAQSCAIYRIE
jgi:hypothetical protein